MRKIRTKNEGLYLKRGKRWEFWSENFENLW